jgi:hypothetical protein
MVLKDWYGPGKDLKLKSSFPSFWEKSLKSSGFDKTLIQCCEKEEIQSPAKDVPSIDPLIEKLLEKEPGIDV